MLKEVGAMFARWHAFDASGGSREKLCLDTLPIRQRMFDYCTIFRHCPDPRVKTRTKRLLANWQHLFTFLENDGGEPTNNAAERALRPAVQWRKNCYGSQSIIGERFAESLLSVTATCKLHGVNAFHFLTAVVRASFSTKHSLPELPLALPN